MLGAEFAHPRDVFPALKAIRGHNMAKAAVEMAAWDLFARQRGEPLARVLGGTRDRIASGVSIGIQPSLDELVAKVERELAAGYRRIKIKIKPGWDVRRRSRRLRARFGAIPLMVDANAAYTLADADHLARARRVRPDDDRAAARLRRCGGSRGAAAAAEDADLPRRVDQDGRHRPRGDRRRRLPHHQHQAGPRRRVRANRSGCTTSAPSHGIPVWHGGMLESGIGRAANIHLSTLPNFSLPGDVAASRRYFDPDLIEPPIEVAADGTIAVPHRSRPRRGDPRGSGRRRDAEEAMFRRSLDVGRRLNSCE